MTPGDFASLQEGHEGLSTEDYIAWKLPYVPVLCDGIFSISNRSFREEEDADDYPFPLTLKSPRKPTGPNSPVEGVLNGTTTP